MGTESDLAFGLATALGYGTSDFIARQASQRIGHLRVLFYMEALGMAILVPLAVFLEHGRWQWSPSWILLIGLGVLNTGASLFLYRSFEYGVLSIVSPLASSYPAVTAVLAILFLSDRPGLPALAGIVLVLAGIVILGRGGVHPSNPPPRNARIGLVSAGIAFAGYGVFYFGLKYVVADVGPVTTTAVVRVVGVAVLLVAVAAGRLALGGVPRSLWRSLGTIGALDSAAFIAYNAGILGGSVAIVGTLSGLFSAVTVALAAALLKERLVRLQYVGLAAIFVGIVLMAVG